jgi:hypothetical protein
MRFSFLSALTAVTLFAAAGPGCGGTGSATSTTGTGGDGSGGTATSGGTDTGGTAGATTGGSNTGGANTGGTGGSNTGGTGGSNTGGTGGASTGGSGGTSTGTGTCMPKTIDASKIGAGCAGSMTCPMGYDCWEFDGFAVQFYCAVLCEDTCECPGATTCMMRSDKGKSWKECVAP